MTQDELTKAMASGKAEMVEPAPLSSETNSNTPSPIEEFLPVLMALRKLNIFLTSAPTFIPQAFQDQIQVVYDGTNYSLYLWINNSWQAFVLGAADVTSIIGSAGIGVSTPTGDVTLTNLGVTSLSVVGSGLSVTNDVGDIGISNTGVTSLIPGSGITISGSTGDITITAGGAMATSVFGGTGADGALIVTSGTTNFDLGGASIFEKNFTSIEISGTGAITFSNPASGGTFIAFRSSGSVTITSSANPAIDCSGCGGAGGTAQNGNVSGAVTGHAGTGFGQWGYQGTITGATQAAVNGGNATGGGGGASMIANGTDGVFNFTGNGKGGTAPTIIPTSQSVFMMPWPIMPGSGGAAGCNNSTNALIAGTAGGNGGGAFYCESVGALNVTSHLKAAGVDGGSTANGGVGGGGGGGGGAFYFIYNSLTAYTPAGVNVSGGAAGLGVTGDNGGAGAAGTSYAAQNRIWA